VQKLKVSDARLEKARGMRWGECRVSWVGGGGILTEFGKRQYAMLSKSDRKKEGGAGWEIGSMTCLSHCLKRK